MGKWHFDENKRVEVVGWMDPKAIAMKRPDAGISRPDVILLAPLFYFQEPRVPINVGYQRMRLTHRPRKNTNA